MTLLLRHGASLVPVFDPNVVTHIIISGRDCGSGKVADKAGYKKMSDVPLSIPTLTWDWIADGISFGKMPEHWDAGGKYIAFPERSQRNSKSDASVSNANARSTIAKKVQTNLERRKYRWANTSKATVVSGTPPIVPEAISGAESGVSVQCDKDDPLAEFYEAAAAEHFERVSARESDDDDSDPGPSKNAKKFAAQFTCDNPHPGPVGGCPNQDIVDQLSTLLDLVKCQPGPEPRQRAYTYSRAISSLRAHPKRIKSFEDAKRLPGVGERTASKIMEIIQTGGLERIKHENSESVQVVKLFQGIYGVGQNTAQMWYNNGCRTLEDLKTNPRIVLSDAQKVGIQFYDDINDRMPRAEAGALFELIKPIALSIDPALFVEIMGSYRRGKADCGDIDILISRDPSDGRTHEGILQELLERLVQAGIVTEHLALPGDFEDLENCYRGLCRLPNVAGSKRRRIDFLTVPWKNKGGALLYYTGDDIFNRSMRYKASTMGFSLNQRGLSAGVVRDPSRRSIKLNKGNIVASETEEEIFKMLNIKYRPPHERVTHFK
ncbi:Nucleotidyltransferase [Cylindrobasidium torrendii FP15055 ss-10]|uniref:DNA polymerase n=1 Tax=Cylindrobasidium torrendii FP15055 ss-10 TaxID=1314674 RepID=A0A0D7BNV9_9AGAR|nr:Nucleotidyltransferase [Cylindrobasidium torrendii FP15055 ss-10]